MGATEVMVAGAAATVAGVVGMAIDETATGAIETEREFSRRPAHLRELGMLRSRTSPRIAQLLLNVSKSGRNLGAGTAREMQRAKVKDHRNFAHRGMPC
jgi:hypothetical protein